MICCRLPQKAFLRAGGLRMRLLWLQLLLCASLIWFAGVHLSRYGDVIAEKQGWSRGWIGFILLASVTSLPELITGLSAVSLVEAPDLALGNALGACVFNLAMIVILDFLHRGQSVYTRASQGHILSAAFGVVLIGWVGINVPLSHQGLIPALGHVSIASLIIAVLYAIAVRMVFRYQRDQLAAEAGERAAQYSHISLRQAVAGYAAAGALVVAMGTWLPFIGDELASAMGWHRSFVGTLLLAMITTVPELVVTVAAFRIGALDLAIGNLLGSNLFNMLIVAVEDAAFLRGSLFAHASPVHIVSALSAMMMTGIAIAGLLYRPKTKLLGLVGWVSLFLFSLYLLNAYVLYLYSE